MGWERASSRASNPDTESTRSLPFDSVFAQRVSADKPKWNLLRGRFVWTRFATKTVPAIPWEAGSVKIPWPKRETPSLPERAFKPIVFQ